MDLQIPHGAPKGPIRGLIWPILGLFRPILGSLGLSQEGIWAFLDPF